MPAAKPVTARPLRAAALALTLAGVLATTVPPARAAHDTRPPPSRCAGQGVDRHALVRYESEVVVDAPLSTLWELQTDVERWPAWQPPVLSAERLDPGRLREGSRFHWTTPAPATPAAPATTLGITSTVRRLRHHDCLLWSGPATGEGPHIDEGVHLWTFREVRGGVRVHTAETWTGAQAEADVPTATRALDAGLDAWLHDLRTTAEARTDGRPPAGRLRTPTSSAPGTGT
ncbi:SRPBCC family protein [Streptomyces sp. AHA2]|uniref:SRPBCC family protein n=1 Tax=Streptomyces sp. AHA2 TaxID=3064526 RepID=UPI002FDF5040